MIDEPLSVLGANDLVRPIHPSSVEARLDLTRDQRALFGLTKTRDVVDMFHTLLPMTTSPCEGALLVRCLDERVFLVLVFLGHRVPAERTITRDHEILWSNSKIDDSPRTQGHFSQSTKSF